jgi:hypothetical protein
MTERANKIYRAWEDKWVESYKFGNQEELSLAAAIRVIADELSYTIFMPNNDVRRCYNALQEGTPYRLTKEFDDLIEFPHGRTTREYMDDNYAGMIY